MKERLKRVIRNKKLLVLVIALFVLAAPIFTFAESPQPNTMQGPMPLGESIVPLSDMHPWDALRAAIDAAPANTATPHVINLTEAVGGLGATSPQLGLTAANPNAIFIPANRNIALVGTAGWGDLQQFAAPGPDEARRHFIVAGQLTLEDGVTLRGNWDSTSTSTGPRHGGAAVNSGGQLTLEEGSTIRNNAAFQGGGVHVENGVVNLSGGDIINNAASHNGGGIAAFGERVTAGSSVSNTTINIYDGTIISGNRVFESTPSGGAVFASNTAIVMSGGILDDNRAQFGGGIDILHELGTFTMSGGTISNNVTQGGSGGGVRIYHGASMTMSDSAAIRGNRTSSHGGGISLVTYSTDPTFGSLEMTGGIIEGNDAAQHGGGVRIDNLSRGSFGPEAIIRGNSAVGSGGGIRKESSVPPETALTIDGTTIGGARPIVLAPDAPNPHANTAQSGGGISVGHAPFTMNGATVSGNGATQSGGGVHVFASGTGRARTISNSTIGGDTAAYRNEAGLDGGGIVLESGTGANLTVNNTTRILHNTADRAGGGISAGGMFATGAATNPATLIMRDVEIARNQSTGTGGGVHAGVFSVVTMHSGDIHHNEAAGNGGGMAVNGNAASFSFGTSAVETGTRTIRDNSAENGGGVHVELGTFNLGTAGIRNITGNTATNNGGGINWIGGTILGGSGTAAAAPVTVSENTATNGAGGGINREANPGLTLGSHWQILDNTAGTNGGGVNLDAGTGVVTLGGASISDNNTAAQNGGGVHLAAGATLSMTSGIISDNAAENGGGLYVGGNFDLSGTGAKTIARNTAANDGGGVWVAEDAYMTMAANAAGSLGITHNSATGTTSMGGGIFTDRYHYSDPLPLAGEYTNLTLLNVTFNNNSASTTERPPANAASFANIGFALPVSHFGHPLNNSDINMETPLLPVTARADLAKALRQLEGQTTSNLSFDFNIERWSVDGDVARAGELPQLGTSVVGGDGRITLNMSDSSVEVNTSGGVATLVKTVDILAGTEFDSPGVFVWRVSEVAGSSGATLPSQVTYSQAVYELTVTVTEVDRVLVASVHLQEIVSDVGGGSIGTGGAGSPLYSWGANANGQLGLGDTTNRSEPTRVGTASNWVQVATAAGGAIALTTEGHIYTWGANWNAPQMGQGDHPDPGSGNITVPTRVGDRNDWAHVSLSGSVALAVTESGHLYTWGVNSLGQLGQGDENSRNVPTEVVGRNDWVIAANIGANGALAITEAGHLYTWGSNASGQLGRGNLFGANRLSPERVEGDTWRHATGGNSHVVGINTSGELFTWGNNTNGQLGLGDMGTGTNRTVPTAVPMPAGTENNWSDAAITNNATAAINTSGELFTMGTIADGQLGRPTSPTPQYSLGQVGERDDWDALGGGNAHFLVISEGLELWAWGSNASGQLGDDTTASRWAPVFILHSFGFAGFLQTGAGTHSMALIRTDPMVFTNTHVRLSTLSASKAVVGEFANMNKEFTFDIELIPSALCEADTTFTARIYQGPTFIESVTFAGPSFAETITLRNGQRIDFSSIPTGVTFNVTERAHVEYQASVELYVGGSPITVSPASGPNVALSTGNRVVGEGRNTADFTNTHHPPIMSGLSISTDGDIWIVMFAALVLAGATIATKRTLKAESSVESVGKTQFNARVHATLMLKRAERMLFRNIGK